MTATELNTYRWLVGPDAEPWLRLATRAGTISPAVVDRLRAALDPERARLVVELSQLRGRAQTKFSGAAVMYFTRRGLEQATGEVLARYKAQAFHPGQQVADLCSGVGGDLLALAERCAVIGYDHDPIMALLARANLTALGCDHGVVMERDVRQADLSSFDGWHADPDRRPDGQRTTNIAYHQPNAATLDRLLRDCPHAMVKLAPAARGTERWAGVAEREWLGRGRECQQLVVRFGEMARHPGLRTATVVGDRHDQWESFTGQGEDPQVTLAPVGHFLVEPHAALRAAGLVAHFAERRAMSLISAHGSWLVADEPCDGLLAASYEVLDHVPLDRKRVISYLRKREYRPVEVKSREGSAPPETLLRQWSQPSGRPVSLLVVRLDRSLRLVIAEKWRHTVGQTRAT